MRIVVVTTSFPRHEDDPSGHFVRSSALALARRGHDVHVIAPGGSAFHPPEPRGELTLHPAGGGDLFGWPGAIARARERPLRLLAAGPFAWGVRSRLAALGPVDRVVAHWIVPSAFPLCAGLRAPLEVVAHGADVRLLLATPSPLRARILAGLLDREARFVFAARGSLDALATSLAPHLGAQLRAASRVKPPDIDVPDVATRSVELRASLGLADDACLAVVACRLVPSKRVSLALEAAALAGPRVHLVVVGDGPERAALERRAVELGGAVRFTGALHRHDALAWIGAADVLVHPSAVEAAPTVVREARALGVRVVACDAGDLAAWAKGDPGIEIAPAAAAELAARLGAPAG